MKKRITIFVLIACLAALSGCSSTGAGEESSSEGGGEGSVSAAEIPEIEDTSSEAEEISEEESVNPVPPIEDTFAAQSKAPSSTAQSSASKSSSASENPVPPITDNPGKSSASSGTGKSSTASGQKDTYTYDEYDPDRPTVAGEYGEKRTVNGKTYTYIRGYGWQIVTATAEAVWVD